MARELATDAALQFLPQFAVSAQWNWQAPAAGFDGRSGSGNLGASLSLPLLDGGLLIQGLREAKARRLQAEAHERTLGSRVRTELHNAWDSLETARRAVPLTERERGLAAEALRLVQIRFAAGTARQVEVLDAVTALRQSELALLRSQLAREQAAAEYLAASGDWLGWAATPAPAAGP
jgi:outer membrane protein